MTLPLALTMGAPAGIGGELTLLAWLKRGKEGLPPFFALDDPARLERLAASLGWTVPLRVIAEPAEAVAVFPEALPVLPVALATRVTPAARPRCSVPSRRP
jgi:4-hydroxythreonine-4-phosphate dehydrogenase